MASTNEDHEAKESQPCEATASSAAATTLPAGEYQKVKGFENCETSATSPTQSQAPPEEDVKKWGHSRGGRSRCPKFSPGQSAGDHWQAQGSVPQYHNNPQPYVVYSSVGKPADSPCEYVVNMFDSWSHRAEGIAGNIWNHLKTGPSVSGTAWGKVNLTAKAITGGGFEPLFRQIFPADPNEKLKTFACYLSTTMGPVVGTIYLSTARVAFCSDRLLTFRAQTGQESWTYYKLSIPIGNVEGVNPVVMKQSPPEKYIQMITTDRHEFWFMGFVSFEKAINHLLDAVSDFRASTGNVAHHDPRN